MKSITNRFFFAIAIITLFILSGCSKTENYPNLFIYQNGEEVDTSVPLAYGVFPESNHLRVVWKEESDSYYTDLLTFKSDAESIEISYQDTQKKEHTQIFKIVSDSIVQDEVGREYQWFRDQVN